MKLACVYILYGCLSAGENGALGNGCKVLGVYAHRQTGGWEAERLHRTDGGPYSEHLFLIPYEVKQ